MNQARTDIANVIEHTFAIQTSKQAGTALAIDYGSHQYLVTAAHIVRNLVNGRVTDEVLPGESIRLISDRTGLVVATVQETAVGPGDPDAGGIDVAVLKLSQRLNLGDPLPPLGHPQDLYVTQRVAMPTAEHWIGWRTGFVVTTRTGTIARIVDESIRGPFTGDLLIEIAAYPGFSGSPIVYWDADGQVRLAGVAARLSWRSVREFQPSPVHSGFIGCFHIQHAVDLIQNLR